MAEARTPKVDVQKDGQLRPVWAKSVDSSDNLFYHATTGDTWNGGVCPSLAEPKGPGVYCFQSTGVRVCASILRGKFYGSARATFPNGECYEGSLRDSQVHGKGDYFWPNGDTYRGEWSAGKRCGMGTFVTKTSESPLLCSPALQELGLPAPRCYRYRGEWKDDLKEGKGIAELFSTPDPCDSGLLRKFEGLFAKNYPASGCLQTHCECGVETFPSVSYDGATSVGDFATWYWQGGSSSGGTDLLVLSSSGEEFASIASRMRKSMPLADIHCIQRVQNHDMRALYDLQRRVLENKVTAPPRRLHWQCKRFEGWAFHAPVIFCLCRLR